MTDSEIILGHFRYAHNALGSFEQKEKVELVSQDIHRAHNLYNFPLKPILTSAITNPEILSKLNLEEGHTARLFGIKWDVGTNTFYPTYT